MGAPTNPRGGFAAVPDPFYWPAVHPVTADLTPREAWRAWQAGIIGREQFTATLEAWNR